MIQSFYRALAVLALFSVSPALHAQSGCTDSPEAPTLALLLVGIAGMFYGSSVLTRRLRLQAVRRRGIR